MIERLGAFDHVGFFSPLAKSGYAMGLILLIVVLLLLFGGLPHYGYSRNWGYGPSGGLGLILVILVILMLCNVLPYRF